MADNNLIPTPATPADMDHLFGPGVVSDASAQPQSKSGKPPVYKFDPLLGVLVDKDGNPAPKQKKLAAPVVRREDFKLDTRSVFDKDRSMLLPGSVITYDADGYRSENAGKKRLPIKPRSYYRRGTHWRVASENVRIEAMCHYGAGANGGQIWSGWSRVLDVGTILECIGWRRYRKDGLVAPQFVYPELPAEAKWSTVWPLEGILEPYTPEEASA
jgi:hypothetical protein